MNRYIPLGGIISCFGNFAPRISRNWLAKQKIRGMRYARGLEVPRDGLVQGHPKAMYALGWIYHNGRGVPPFKVTEHRGDH
jgi:hypothetical protein